MEFGFEIGEVLAFFVERTLGVLKVKQLGPWDRLAEQSIAGGRNPARGEAGGEGGGVGKEEELTADLGVAQVGVSEGRRWQNNGEQRRRRELGDGRRCYDS